MAKVRAHVIVRGEVQGVFFRATARQVANSLGVTGWVSNLPDYSVELVCEGEENDVKAMVDWCRQGPPRAEVERVEVEWLPATGEFAYFSVR